MKVGDYVRTEDGFISKYIGKNKNKCCVGNHLSFESTIRDIRFEDTSEDNIIWESEIKKGLVKIKSSNELIDLIKKGDYVNGYKVIDIVKGFKVIVNKLELDSKTGLYFNIGITNIKSIVTKEQYERMEYRIGE